MGKEIPDYIKYWMGSIRQFMPDANVIQTTDMDTPIIDETNEVIRFESKKELIFDNINNIGVEFLSKLDIEEMIFVDTDMMFNHNIEYLLDDDFEVSIATRMRKDRMKRWYKRRYPYNSVIVIKTSKFWKDCYEVLSGFNKTGWFSAMRAVKKVVDSGRYKVRILDGNIFNKVPQHEDDFNKKVKVFHFKGFNRKAYMKPFYEKHICQI